MNSGTLTGNYNLLRPTITTCRKLVSCNASTPSAELINPLKGSGCFATSWTVRHYGINCYRPLVDRVPKKDKDGVDFVLF